MPVLHLPDYYVFNGYIRRYGAKNVQKDKFYFIPGIERSPKSVGIPARDRPPQNAKRYGFIGSQLNLPVFSYTIPVRLCVMGTAGKGYLIFPAKKDNRTMALKYALFDNPIMPGPQDRRAIVQATRTLTLDDVIGQMTSRGSTVTRAEAVSVFEEFFRAVNLLTREGHAISTPLFRIAPSITGIFNGDDDSFDPARHRVKLHCHAGVLLREIEQQVDVEKISTQLRLPVPLHFHDNATGCQDSFVTPGEGASITGTALKFDVTDNDQGIFFVNSANGDTTRVRTVLRNKPRELIFAIPFSLGLGTYKIEVRSILKCCTTVRSGTMPYELTVR
jgi:hypothetical protein